jgi:acyl-CoA synthetase (NDP forming)
VTFVPARRAADADAAVAAADDLGYPVVVKALGRLHKSDAGGVVLGIADREQLERTLTPLVNPRSARRETVGA